MRAKLCPDAVRILRLTPSHCKCRHSHIHHPKELKPLPSGSIKIYWANSVVKAVVTATIEDLNQAQTLNLRRSPDVVWEREIRTV